MMAEAVLDASAILAAIFDEPGAAAVDAVLPGAAASAANIAEVASKLADREMPATTIEAVITGLQLEIHELDLAQALANAQLRRPTRGSGLSLGDRTCLALAKRLGLPALTTDRVWSQVSDAVGVDVLVIR